jgi:hypothetical protein
LNNTSPAITQAQRVYFNHLEAAAPCGGAAAAAAGGSLVGGAARSLVRLGLRLD